MSIGEERDAKKTTQSEKIAADVEAFLQAGGKIQHKTAFDNAARRKEKGFKGHSLGVLTSTKNQANYQRRLAKLEEGRRDATAY